MKKILKQINRLACLGCLFFTINLQAQLSSDGSETVVNSTTANNQQRPAIAMEENGSYVIVWESKNQDGDGYGIYGRIYFGTGADKKTQFKVNSTTANHQRFPDVAKNSDGDFVVVWQSYNQDGDSWGIYFQRYNEAYYEEGSETLVNTTTSGRQCMPKVAMDDDGNFVITWESEGEIHAAFYSADGTVLVSEFQVNSTTPNIQNYPNVAMDKDGSFVIVWQSYDQDGDGFGVYSQRYDGNGAVFMPSGSETLVNTTTSGQQITPNVSMDKNGNYAIVWTDSKADGDGEGVFGQLFNADGSTNGNEFQVNTTTTNAQENPQVDMAREGMFSVVWNSYGQDGQYTGIYNQSYHSNGSTNGSELLVNSTTNYFQQFPAIALWANDETVIVWQDGQLNESNSLDTDGYGVVFQRYDAAALPVELLYFYAEKTNENVQLDWQTATEINNSHFDVEWSFDGIDFQKIGEVAGAGTTSEIQFYEFLHTNPMNGVNYYRLKQFDFNGEYEYSKILNIEYQTTNINYRIFPNPATGYFVIENAQIGDKIQIFSSNGQLLNTLQIPNTQYQIPISHLPKGTYFIKIRETVKRILIQ